MTLRQLAKEVLGRLKNEGSYDLMLSSLFSQDNFVAFGLDTGFDPTDVTVASDIYGACADGLFEIASVWSHSSLPQDPAYREANQLLEVIRQVLSEQSGIEIEPIEVVSLSHQMVRAGLLKRGRDEKGNQTVALTEKGKRVADVVGMRIRITKRPHGKAPDEIRDAWIGLTMPVSADAALVPEEGDGVLTETDGSKSELSIQDVYPIEFEDAIQALRDAGRNEAADWWEWWYDVIQGNRPYYLDFDRASCEEVKE